MDGAQSIISVVLGATSKALAANEVATVSCTSESVAIAAPAAIAVSAATTSSDATAIDARGVPDLTQTPTRVAEALCSVTAPGRTAQSLSVPITVHGVAQPSFALLCPLAEGADPLATMPATCGVSATTTGNSTLLIIGGSASAGCPQPPFDTAATTRVTIGGVVVDATVVAGSSGTRLRTRTPSIAALQALRNAAVDDFAFGYYGIEIATLAGAHGTFGGSVAVGASAPRASGGANTAQQACAERGYCPDVTPSAAGFFYTEKCEGWLDPAVDARWKVTEFATLFAYGRPPNCVACPNGCRCPGGRRCRAEPGYYSGDEDLRGAVAPSRCAPPALQRCLGYDASVSGTRCGAGFVQGSVGCNACAKGYFVSLGTCEACPTADFNGAVLMPALANLAGGAAIFFAIFGAKLIWMLVSAACDPTDERSVGVVAFDALRQTMFFVVATVVALQMLASVVVGATGDAPANMRWLALSLGAFVFEPPMVNPECVDGFDTTELVQLAVMFGGIAVAALDKTLQLLPWLRAESLCFGWKCCSKLAPLTFMRRLCFTLGTPFLRYFLSTGLTVAYVRVVRVAMTVLDCSPSEELGGAYALDTHARTACFGAEHAPLWTLGLITLVAVGIVWPALTLWYLTQRFTLAPREERCWRLRFVEALCDRPGGGEEGAEPIPTGWTQHFSEERGTSYFAHVESGASLWERPTASSAAAAIASHVDARAAMSALAPGWTEHVDAHGRSYYCNATSGATSWDRHAAEAPADGGDGGSNADGDAGALPEGWAELHSSEHNASYYYHAMSSQTLWERPKRASAQKANAKAKAAASADVADGALPEGWEALHSPEHGATYYHHAASSQTLWERPQSAAPTHAGSRLSMEKTRETTNALAEIDAIAEEVSDDARVGGGEDALPEGWEALHSPEHGATYYHHTASSQTLWERPGKAAGAQQGAGESSSQARSAAEGAIEAEGGERREDTAPLVAAAAAPAHGDDGLARLDSELALEVAAKPTTEGPPAGACVTHLNEVGCIPVCWRAKLRVDRRPALVQGRVDRLGGRARAYDVYVDNAFEPRFFWIPPLRNYTLLCLTALDHIFSGRTPPTVAGALARCLLSSLVVLLFTVAVLAPCPYHRIDRWNIAKRIALLVLQNIGSGTTLALTLVELDGGQPARDATAYLASTMLIMLPLCFFLVLIAFLLSKGTGWCKRCKHWYRRRKAAREANRATKKHADEDGGRVSVVGTLVEMRPTRRGASTGAPPRASSSSIAAPSFAFEQPMRALDAEETKLRVIDTTYNEHFIQPSTPEEVTFYSHVANPMVSTLAVQSRRSGIDIDVEPARYSVPFLGTTATQLGTSSGSSSTSEEDEEEEATRFVTWRQRKSSAATLADALYGARGSSGASGTAQRQVERIDAVVREKMFDGANSLTVPETLALLRTRAKGTDLGGNLLRQMQIVQASSDEDGLLVTVAAFGAALHSAIDADKSGAVAQWLLAELEVLDDAAVVEEHDEPAHSSSTMGSGT